MCVYECSECVCMSAVSVYECSECVYECRECVYECNECVYMSAVRVCHILVPMNRFAC